MTELTEDLSWIEREGRSGQRGPLNMVYGFIDGLSAKMKSHMYTWLSAFTRSQGGWLPD
ncbi:MAG: hypothetical protein LC670_10960 [Flavobacteriales bacterium]|nr:hypothetical protein [Flavobacteriales bacterium]